MRATIGILGANGVYGRHLVPRLCDAGHRVRAIVRRPEAANAARACGTETAVADIFDTESMVSVLSGCDTGINLATSLPGPSGRGTYEANDALRSKGTINWIEACRRAGVERVLQQSIGMVNASGSDAWSDEQTVYDASGDDVASRAIAASVTMEGIVTASELDWIVLRGGLFYGPGTGFDDRWHAMAEAGKLRLPGDGNDFVSLVHIADMARATVQTLECWPSQQSIIVADDEPARWRDMLGHVANVAGAAQPAEGGAIAFPSFRLRNAKARETLGWAPSYATYRQGLAR